MSENPKFAELLANEKITFIGPPASAIVSIGSKRYFHRSLKRGEGGLRLYGTANKPDIHRS